MVWHILRANILLIVNVILTGEIRVFMNTLTKKITTFFCSGIINLLFDGLAYNTSGHFVCPCIARIFPRARNFKSAIDLKLLARILPELYSTQSYYHY